jgi:hypothetical protein
MVARMAARKVLSKALLSDGLTAGPWVAPTAYYWDGWLAANWDAYLVGSWELPSVTPKADVKVSPLGAWRVVLKVG